MPLSKEGLWGLKPWAKTRQRYDEEGVDVRSLEEQRGCRVIQVVLAILGLWGVSSPLSLLHAQEAEEVVEEAAEAVEETAEGAVEETTEALEETGEAIEEAAEATGAVAEEATEAVVEEVQEIQAEVTTVEDLDPNDPLYWARVRGIETIQRREVLKENRLALTVYGGIVPNNTFEQYYPVGLRLNYFLLENLGFELAGAHMFSSDTGLADVLEDEQGVGSTAVLLGDTQLQRANFGVVWSPVFGKVSWLDSTINYFDFYLFGGIGGLRKESQTSVGAPTSVGYAPEGALGAGMLFFFNDWSGLRLDFRQFLFQKVGGRGVATPSEVSLGATFML